MRAKTSLGDLQLAIMRVLWERGEAPVAEVHSALLEERGLAPTTVATMLVKMERKGVVRHRTEGRRFLYRATVSEDEVTRHMVAQLADRLFGGSATALASHLIAEHEIDREELDNLRRQLEEREGES
jgi:BlaI family transcriptional regulator, penicillinase repressor